MPHEAAVNRFFNTPYVPIFLRGSLTEARREPGFFYWQTPRELIRQLIFLLNARVCVMAGLGFRGVERPPCTAECNGGVPVLF